MLIKTQIAQRLSEARYATDLGLIYDIWPDQDRSHDAMRVSDHLAIRKAASALDRVGDALARQLTSNGVANYRALPEIKPTTRVRKTPQRFWLEIDLNEPRHDGAAREVLFVEFTKTEVRFGVRLPIHAFAFEKRAAAPLHHLVSEDAIDAGNWQLEQRRPPAEPAACSNDLNTWLAGRVTAQKQKAVFQTVSKACPSTRPSMTDLVAGLSEALTLCNEIKDQKMNRTCQTISDLTSHCAMMI